MMTYPNGKYNWEYIVREYAKSEDILFADAMRFLSQRASLQSAVELLGIEVMPQSNIVKSLNAENTLNDFGRYLDNKGYSVPPLYELSYLQQHQKRKKVQDDTSKPVYTMFKGVNMNWVLEDVIRFEEFWRQGMSIPEIARELHREPDLILLLAIDRAEIGKIEARQNGVRDKDLQHA